MRQHHRTDRVLAEFELMFGALQFQGRDGSQRRLGHEPGLPPAVRLRAVDEERVAQVHVTRMPGGQGKLPVR